MHEENTKEINVQQAPVIMVRNWLMKHRFISQLCIAFADTAADFCIAVFTVKFISFYLFNRLETFYNLPRTS